MRTTPPIVTRLQCYRDCAHGGNGTALEFMCPDRFPRSPFPVMPH